MKKILTVIISMLCVLTLASCNTIDTSERTLTKLNTTDKINILPLAKQMTSQNVMCDIDKDRAIKKTLYGPKMSCLRNLADSGNIIPMFLVASADKLIYHRTKNEDALKEYLIYLKVIVAFSRRPEFDLSKVSVEDRMAHKDNIQTLIFIANMASKMLFQQVRQRANGSKNKDAVVLLKEITDYEKRIVVK